MRLSARLNDALQDLLKDTCQVLRDPYLTRRCGRPRQLHRRCFACAEIRGKPLAMVRSHAVQFGFSLIGAFLEGAKLAGGDLRWVTMRFAKLAGADLSGADLRSTDFSGEQGYPGADLSNADLRGADLTHSRMRFLKSIAGASFDGAVLEDVTLSLDGTSRATGASFANADLGRSRLTDIDLGGVSFRGARLAEADLRRSNFSGADFSGADLTDADLSGAVIDHATFDGACLIGARLPGGKSIKDLQSSPAPADVPQSVLGECMRAFAAIPSTANTMRLRVLARRALAMRREEALDLILPILEKKEIVEQCAEEAVEALRILGREPATRPFLIGLLFRGAEEVRLEAASVLATPPLDDETADLFESCLTSDELTAEFQLGIFRALAPAVEDGDKCALALARELLDAGRLFDGELIAALGQAGVADPDYLTIIENVALDREQPRQARLAAARDIAERFFDPGTCARLSELLCDAEEAPAFRRDVFWFLSRRVTSGDPDAAALARKLLKADPDLEADVRWALAEGGDASQAPFFLGVVRAGVERGWRDGPAAGVHPSYDDLVRAAQILGRIATADAIKPLASLIRKEKSAGGPPPGEPFSLTDSAREAILQLRKSAEAPAPSRKDASAVTERVDHSRATEVDLSMQKVRAAEKASRRKAEEKEAARKAREEESRRKADAEKARRKADEDEARRKAKEEEARHKADAEKARRKAEEDAARRKAKEEEARRKAVAEKARRKAEEDKARKAKEEEAQRKADAEKARREADEDRARREAEEKEARRKAEQEEARRKVEEEDARRKAEEEAARRRADVEEARRKAEEDERARIEAEAVAVAEESIARKPAARKSKKKARKKAAKKKAVAKKAAPKKAKKKVAKKKAAKKKTAKKKAKKETKKA